MKQKWLKLLVTGTVIACMFTGCNGTSENTTDKLNEVQQETVTNTDNSEEDTASDVDDASGSDAASESEETTDDVYVFEFTDAVNTEGEKISSDIFTNSKLTMINVWATFCGPCINEMPDLGEISSSYDSAEFQIVGIISDTMEGDSEMLAEAKAIIEETGADYTHLLLNEELYVNLVGASDSVPTSYFFNEKGELLGYLVGAQSKESWESLIQDILKSME